MKRIITYLLCAALCLALTACGQTPAQDTNPAGEPAQSATPSDSGVAVDGVDDEAGGKTLVVYFSCTGNTKALAEYAAEELGATLFAIDPAEPYTADDLDYTDSDSRSSQEMADPDARPALSATVADMTPYATVILGYPIWHGQAPRIISTFLESCDLSGKTILPFCTSASSGIGSSDTALHALAPDGNWLAGSRFSAAATQSEIAAWLADNGLQSAD